jgi:hypothetical protein
MMMVGVWSKFQQALCVLIGGSVFGFNFQLLVGNGKREEGG